MYKNKFNKKLSCFLLAFGYFLTSSNVKSPNKQNLLYFHSDFYDRSDLPKTPKTLDKENDTIENNVGDFCILKNHEMIENLRKKCEQEFQSQSENYFFFTSYGLNKAQYNFGPFSYQALLHNQNPPRANNEQYIINSDPFLFFLLFQTEAQKRRQYIENKMEYILLSHILIKAMGIFIDFPEELQIMLTYNNKNFSRENMENIEKNKEKIKHILHQIPPMEYQYISCYGKQYLSFFQLVSLEPFGDNIEDNICFKKTINSLLLMLKINPKYLDIQNVKKLIVDKELNSLDILAPFVNYENTFLNRLNASDVDILSEESNENIAPFYPKILSKEEEGIYIQYYQYTHDIFEAIIRAICDAPYVDSDYLFFENHQISRKEEFTRYFTNYISSLSPKEISRQYNDIENISVLKNSNIKNKKLFDTKIDIIREKKTMVYRTEVFKEQYKIINFLRFKKNPLIFKNPLQEIMMDEGYDSQNTIILKQKKKEFELFSKIMKNIGIFNEIAIMLYGPCNAEGINSVNINSPYKRFKRLFYLFNEDKELSGMILNLYKQESRIRNVTYDAHETEEFVNAINDLDYFYNS